VYYGGPCLSWGIVGWLLTGGQQHQHHQEQQQQQQQQWQQQQREEQRDEQQQRLAARWQRYSHFILLSSVVRGPFLPTYLQGAMHWTQPLLR
jgi:hypothetical protein